MGTNGWSFLGWGSAGYGVVSITYSAIEKFNKESDSNTDKKGSCWDCFVDAGDADYKSNNQSFSGQYQLKFGARGQGGFIILGGSVMDVTVTDLASGQTARYTIVASGVGVGLPGGGFSSEPLTFSAKEAKGPRSFQGYGYMGGASLSVGGGIGIGGGIKIPNGPFVPYDYFQFKFGDIDIGVSHSITYWYLR